MPTATAERKRSRRSSSSNGRPTTREETAERLLKILTEEPQSEAALRRALKIPESSSGRRESDMLKLGLGVLEAQGLIKQIPNTAGSKQGGWVLATSSLEAAEVPVEKVEFPYEWVVLNVDDMFIDPDYQRPLTAFVNKIHKEFDPVLFQVLAVNLRDTPNKEGKRIAIIDGQTRWTGARRRGIKRVPCIQFIGLSPEQEADIFWRLQKERRGHVSVHRFRAQLKAKHPGAVALLKTVKSAGWMIGDKTGQLKAVAALESCFRREGYLLERTLVDLKAAFPDIVPEDYMIRGLHYFLMHYPLNERRRVEVDDEKLVKKLRTQGVAGLRRKMISAKELSGNKPNARLMAEAIQSVYTSR